MKNNRRIFLKDLGRYGAGVCLSPLISCQKPPKKSLGVALVGLGGYSRGQLAPALQLTKYCHLSAIVTGSPEKVPEWQKNYNIKDSNVYSYQDFDKIANNDEVDVIYIVLPTALHAEYAIAAANAGKHVWCEKPMAMNEKECQAIIDACKKNKVRLSIGYRMQHEKNTKTLIGYRHTKPYGDFTEIIAQAGYAGGGGTGWRHQKSMGGGAMYDMGVYTVNAIRYATGLEIKKVISAEHIISRPELFKEVDETTQYQVEMSNGLIAQGWTSVGESKNLLRVNCDKGWYELSPMQSYNGVQGKTSDGILLNEYVESQQALQMDDDALAIIENKEMMVPGIEGLKDIRVIEAIFRSAATGESVSL